MEGGAPATPRLAELAPPFCTMSKIDKAVVLAAGRGTRMRELTAEVPKPMIQVRGKPVLQHIIEGLRDAGIPELLVIREKSQPGEVERWSAISERAVPFYNAGLYAFRSSIFEFTAKLKPSPRGEYELTDAIRDLAQSGKKVQALELTGEWADVRDPEILARLNR